LPQTLSTQIEKLHSYKSLPPDHDNDTSYVRNIPSLTSV